MRLLYSYQTDDGFYHRISQKQSNGDAVGNAPATLDIPPLPAGFRCRRLLLLNTATGQTKRVAIGSASNALWVSGGSVTIDGGNYKVVEFLREDRGRLG